MDHLETPYDTEVQFIECTVCEKSIRGENLYKIHLTTSGHLKKEKLLISQGIDIKPQKLPRFRDILHYLDYLKLDEPIIGLSFVKELPSSEPNEQYTCKMCSSISSLTEMVYHVIGRKHRVKYLNTQRPDLVTWDGLGQGAQAGKLVRAKAEVVERQDGRGTPSLLRNAEAQGKFNNSQGLQWQNHNRGTMLQNNNPAGKVPPLLPELENLKMKLRNQRRYFENQSQTPAFQSDNADMSRDRWRQQDDVSNRSRMEDRDQYRESHLYTDSVLSDCYSEQDDQCVKESLRITVFDQSDSSQYDYREDGCFSQPQQEQRSYDSSYQERGAPTESYSDERRREQVLSTEYLPSQQAYLKGDDQRWSREPDRHDGAYRDRQDPGEPQAKRRSLPPPVDSEQVHSHVFSIVRDYQHERRAPLGGDMLDYMEPGRAGASTSHRLGEVTRTISNIPEPFRRFLTGDDGNGHVKRKRTSRFSDATPEEVQRTKEIFNVDGGNTNSSLGGDYSVSSRAVDSGMHHSDFYRGSQNAHYTESYQRGGSHSDGVFDMLKNVEIENAEEADFLKNKLCNLLKEFKSKKQEKESQDGYGGAGTSRSYGDVKPEPRLPRHPLYDASPSEESKEHYSDQDHRRELPPEHQHQEYSKHSVDTDGQSSRSRYEGMFGKAHASHLDEPPYYPERFQEPQRSHDYQPAAGQFYDSPLAMGQAPRTAREQRYSNTLDKITSTLLQLVSRK